MGILLTSLVLFFPSWCDDEIYIFFAVTMTTRCFFTASCVVASHEHEHEDNVGGGKVAFQRGERKENTSSELYTHAVSKLKNRIYLETGVV